MLNFASEEFSDWHESNNYYEISRSDQETPVKSDSVKLFADKLGAPPIGEPIARPRLLSQLEKSLAQFSAALVVGRAGTGKTCLAADFARRRDCRIAWYKAETADADWKIFARYLAASLDAGNAETAAFDDLEVSAACEVLAARFNEAAQEKPLLIVIDDWHSVFDARWFAEFFHGFVPLLNANVNLLFIARTMPPLQVWRLRSKQVLGVLDEKLLAFTLSETAELFARQRLPLAQARHAHRSAYGKISRLREIIEKKTAAAPPIYI